MADDDYSLLTESDMAMFAHAMRAGAIEVDFSEFYCDEDDRG